MNEYIRSFVIGSSLPVFIPFFLKVANINDKYKNYSYESYSIIAPLYFGILNIISLLISKNFNLTTKQRCFFTSIISPLLVILFVKLVGSYNYNQTDWLYYIFNIFI